MKKVLILVSLLIGVLCILFVIDVLRTGTIPFSPHAKLERYAEEVIRTCSKDSYPPRCYDIEIPKLMDQGLSMEEAFATTEIIQNKDSSYFYCHVLGHNLSAKETAKDPSQWTEVIARCPTGQCGNGCLHGAAQERFRDDVLSPEQIQDLTPQLAQICESASGRNFTGLEKSSCYHSLGHLSMYITGADIHAATNICDAIAKKETVDHTQTCYEGAYMQIFQPLEPEDFALVKHIPAHTIEEAEVFCDSFTGERRSACHRESWPLYHESLVDGSGLEAFCTLVPDATSIKRCYNAMFYVITAQVNFDISRIESICMKLPEKRKAQCFGNSASRFLETDYRLIPKALELCAMAEREGMGSRCYDELTFYSSFNFHKDSLAMKQLCAGLPEPWKTTCKEGKGDGIHPSEYD